MADQEDKEIKKLMRKFEAGDRSPKLMARLSQKAFNAFHAPWEPAPPEWHNSEAEGTSGALNLSLKDDEEDEAPRRMPVSLEFGMRLEQTLKPTSHEDVNEQEPGEVGPDDATADSLDPLFLMDMALEFMGHHCYLAQGLGLILDCPYDPEADSHSRLAFKVDMENECFCVISQSDLHLYDQSSPSLETLCRVYNRRLNGMEALLYFPEPGARARIHLSTHIPLGLAIDGDMLAARLANVLRKERNFWRYLKRNNRPLQ